MAPVVAGYLQDRDPDVRWAATHALAALRGGNRAAAVGQLLADAALAARAYAALLQDPEGGPSPRNPHTLGT